MCGLNAGLSKWYGRSSVLVCHVLKEFWCQLPEDGEITAPKQVKYVKDGEHKLQSIASAGVT